VGKHEKGEGKVFREVGGIRFSHFRKETGTPFRKRFNWWLLWRKVKKTGFVGKREVVKTAVDFQEGGRLVKESLWGEGERLWESKNSRIVSSIELTRWGKGRGKREMSPVRGTKGREGVGPREHSAIEKPKPSKDKRSGEGEQEGGGKAQEDRVGKKEKRKELDSPGKH